MKNRTREEWFSHAAKRALNKELYQTVRLHGAEIPRVSGIENKAAAFLAQHDDAVLRAAYDRYMAAASNV